MNGLADIRTGKTDEHASTPVCCDLPECACRQQARNIALHVTSLSLTRIGEGLADAKLVLAWLLDAIGAPTWAMGLLVPVRESLAMLPQLLISARLKQQPIRKHFYVVGCVVQGAAIIGIGAVALTLAGTSAAISVLALMAAFALGRSLCSISHKDVIAKTVNKGRRGSVSGIAGSVAAAVTLLMAVAYSASWLPLTVPVVASVVILGGMAWLAAALVFGSIRETPDAAQCASNGLAAVIAQFTLLRTDARLRQLIFTRILLLSTALAPPFYIALSGNVEAGGLGTLGLFMIASATAGLASAYVWGQLADRSSRRALMVAAGLAAIAHGVTALTTQLWPHRLQSDLFLPAMLFLLMTAHHGVRLARSVHVVDMADLDNRAAYTALSNTVLGLVLLAAGVFGFIGHYLGLATVLLVFAMMATLAIKAASGLDEVQSTYTGTKTTRRR